MRNLLKTAMTVAVAAGALLGAKSAAAATGVLLVHGTSDHTNATANYWTQDTVNKIAAGRAYKVVSYQGSACSGIGSSRKSEGYETYNCSSWSSIADQAAAWLSANPSVTDVVIVTHSNGSAPTRYMLTHPTATSNVSTLVNKTRKVIYLAGDNSGTELADKVTTSGSLANIGNAIVNFFGGGSYNTPAVWAQRRDRMAIYNSTSNGAYNTSSYNCGQGVETCGGKVTQYVRGTDVTAAIWSSAAYCGGYASTVGLKLAKAYAGFVGGCGDGFIGCDSAGYNGRQLMSDSKLNHNQSRRDCRGMPGTISNAINNLYGYTAADPEYTISPAAQACNATISGTFNGVYYVGCSAADRTDSVGDYDCQAAYGTETFGATTVTFPNDYATMDASKNWNGLAYKSFSCPDSWRGDGVCDMCIVAKYGYDGKEGTATGGDDCINNGPGTTNYCSDIGHDGWSWGTYEYTAGH